MCTRTHQRRSSRSLWRVMGAWVVVTAWEPVRVEPLAALHYGAYSHMPIACLWMSCPWASPVLLCSRAGVIPPCVSRAALVWCVVCGVWCVVCACAGAAFLHSRSSPRLLIPHPTSPVLGFHGPFFIHPCIHPSIHASIHPSMHQSIHPPTRSLTHSHTTTHTHTTHNTHDTHSRLPASPTPTHVPHARTQRACRSGWSSGRSRRSRWRHAPVPHRPHATPRLHGGDQRRKDAAEAPDPRGPCRAPLCTPAQAFQRRGQLGRGHVQQRCWCCWCWCCWRRWYRRQSQQSRQSRQWQWQRLCGSAGGCQPTPGSRRHAALCRIRRRAEACHRAWRAPREQLPTQRVPFRRRRRGV